MGLRHAIDQKRPKEQKASKMASLLKYMCPGREARGCLPRTKRYYRGHGCPP